MHANSGEGTVRRRFGGAAWARRPGVVSLVSLVLACTALPAAAQRTGTTAGSTVTIADAVATEGGTARFEITYEPPLVGNDNYTPVTYIAGTAGLEDLGSNRPTEYLIPVAEDRDTLNVPIHDDDIAEDDETFTVRVFLDDGAFIQATGTIARNDGGTVRIGDVTVAEDAGTATFTVTLSDTVPRAVALDLTYAAGSADPATDLGRDRPTTVTIPAGETAATFAVPIVDDAIVEGDETFTVTISSDDLPDMVTIADRDATGTITDGDMATVTIGPAQAPEGEPLVFRVALSQAVAEAVTVTWTAAGGTATLQGADTDLAAETATTGTVTFPARDPAPQTITLPTRLDSVSEGDETVTVTLAAAGTLPAGVRLDPDGAEGTILDASTEVSITATTAPEGEPLAFEVQLTQVVPAAVTVTWRATGGTATLQGADADLVAGTMTTGTVTFPASDSTPQPIVLPTIADNLAEGPETVTVTIAAGGTLPDGVSLGVATATGTILDQTSVLVDPRRLGAATALRRHVSHFDRMTTAVVLNRLQGRGPQPLSYAANATGERETVAVSTQMGERRGGGWVDASYARVTGLSAGRQADLYGGVDYRNPDRTWLLGALAGYERADLEVGEADFQSAFTQVGLYGGARLAERLVVDGAASYGRATPTVAEGDVSASYAARRLTVRGSLTGDIGLAYGAVQLAPQVGVAYARERLGHFTDSAGGRALAETLRLGRFSAGPRLTWPFARGELAGGARVQWDFLPLEDGTDRRLSVAADLGVRVGLGSRLELGVYGEVDGLGLTDRFATYGARVELAAGF